MVEILKCLRRLRSLVVLSITVSILSGCGADNIDYELHEIIRRNSLTGDPALGREIPSIESKKAQLGMHLFYSKSLSGDRDTACVSCHHPMLGGGDGLSLPIGVAAVNQEIIGLGRTHDMGAPHFDGGPTVPRNAPTTFNIALWDAFLFHDGRLESIGKSKKRNGDDGFGFITPDSVANLKDPIAGSNLVQAQARFPVTSAEEMKGFNHEEKTNQDVRDFIAARLGGYNISGDTLSDNSYWLRRFRDAYNSPSSNARELITEQNIAELLGEYQRSQVFVNTPWKEYISGNYTALSLEAKRGAILFFKSVEEKGAGCSRCHSGDFFTDENFYNLAIPQFGRGKGDGVNGNNDFGRFRVTADEEDLFAFRTPSLINVEVTGPWGHTGAYTSLDAVVKHHLDPRKAINGFGVSQLEQHGIQNLYETQVLSSEALKTIDLKNSVELSKTEIDYIVSFLNSLTDPCVKSRRCLRPWIPDFLNDVDPNGDQLIGMNFAGEIL